MLTSFLFVLGVAVFLALFLLVMPWVVKALNDYDDWVDRKWRGRK